MINRRDELGGLYDALKVLLILIVVMALVVVSVLFDAPWIRTGIIVVIAICYFASWIHNAFMIR
ncbi:MAG: hypothetical protein FWE76_08655 [Symbiobacteriaceae bacterium]|nr:hypothetical protein [Symbiobacteriaceae bacterium]